MSLLYQYCRHCSPKLLEYRWLSDEVTCGSFVSVFLVEKRADPLLLRDFLGRACPVCSWTYSKSWCKRKKETKKRQKRTKRSGCIRSRQKNTDTDQSGQRIKSLFFILYIWKPRLQYVALLCCTNEMCLWHFSNLIYFTEVFFVPCFTIKV